jgi:hypothetical protein
VATTPETALDTDNLPKPNLYLTVIPISALILHLDLDLYLIVSKSASEVDSKPENLAEWPFDAITDIFTGLYLPLSELDAVYGPMPEEMD